MSLKVPLFAWRAFLRDLRAGELSVLLVAIVLGYLMPRSTES